MALVLCAVWIGCPSLSAGQNPVPTAPASEITTYDSQQREQAFATRKLAASPRKSRWVSIHLGDRTLRAFVTYPQVSGRVPVVLVMHEVFGLTDSTRNTADQIAALGYITVAPDMVSGLAPNGGGTSGFPNSTLTAQVMTTQLNEAVNGQFNAWADYALHVRGANGNLAIVGLSWGGGAAFRYAASPAHTKALKRVFVFYDVGPPVFTQGPNRANNPPFPVDTIDVPIYGFYASNDERVMKSLQATKDAMAAAGKLYESVVFDGADHAFMRYGEDPANTNPANAAAVRDSMQRLKELLGQLTVSAQARPTGDGVSEVEDARLHAELIHDIGGLTRMLAPNLWYVHANGKIEDKTTHINTVANDGGFLTDAKLSDRSVEVEGNMAVTHGTVDYFNKAQPGIPRRARYLGVYRRSKGQWQLVAWQNLPVNDGS